MALSPPRIPGTKLPVYGFGAGKAVLSGQIHWYADPRGQTALVLVEPGAADEITVLPTDPSVHFAGPHVALDGSISIGVSSPGADGWRYWLGTLTATQAGCHQITIVDGARRDVVGFMVEAGSLPPG